MIFRQLARDTAIYGGADLITKVIGFFAFPIIASALSPKAFGAVELILTATGFLGLIMNCGLNTAVQRFYFEYDTKARIGSSVVTSGLCAQAVLGIGVTFIGFSIIPMILPKIQGDRWPLTWVALVAALLLMAFTQLTQYILDVVRLHFAPWRFFWFSLGTRTISITLGTLSVVVLGLGVDGFLSAQALVLFMALPLGFCLIRKDFILGNLSLSWMRELVRFGYPFIFAGLAYFLFSSTDRWMLATMSTVQEVGIYSVAIRFATVVLFVSAAFGQAWAPLVFKIKADYPCHYPKIYGNIFLLLLFIMLSIGGAIALFSGEIIGMIMPSEYHQSALPLAILCFAVILQSTQQVTAVGISLEKKTYLLGYISLFATFLNLVANWILIPKLGAAGASWATLFSYAVLTGSYLYCTQHLHPLQIQWRRLILLLFLCLLMAICSISFISLEFDLKLVCLKALLVLICFLSGWQVLPIHSLKEFRS